MESSSLTLAHDHAKAASVATQSSDTTVAINEHALAAGEFARAADGTSSAEALRTLKLLEAHHRKLSELLRLPTQNPPATSNPESEVQTASEKPLSTSAAVAELRASKSDLGARPSSPRRAPPSLNAPRRLPPRDLSSSIASNLANARGIRATYTRQPLTPSVSTQQAPGSLEAHPRREIKKKPTGVDTSQPSWIPPTSPHRKSETTSPNVITKSSEQTSAGPQDEGFSRFYNTFENILSKLSAPLAFAGLPLIAEEPSAVPAETSPTKKRPQTSDRRDSDPDISRYISKAALRATSRDGHSATDSFYVVPTSGHTVSYARILSYEEKERRRLAASVHGENPELFANPDEEDDFVDARETPMPPSPAFSRQSSKVSKPSTKQLENKVEELGMENKSLKEVVDKLSKRLHTFEMSAQQNGMALQESMRLMRDLSPARDPRTLTAGSDESMKRRILELEEHASLGAKEIERLGKENEKLRIVVARYRDRWEKLKEGAKTRRDGGSSKKDGDTVPAQ